LAEGFLVDRGEGRTYVSTWQAGKPKKSIWVGIKQSKADQLQVSTWRCQRCGYLESYAPQP